MKKSFFWLLLCACASLPLTAQTTEWHEAPNEAVCGLDFQPIEMHSGLPANALYRDIHADPLARAHDAAMRLTFDEKLALTGGVKQFYFPGVHRLGIPAVYFADATQGIHEKQICIKVEKSTAFPSGQALAATWDLDLAHEYARAISDECRAWGVSVLLGPGLNLYRNSEGGRNFEYFGEDP
ncbi:MAG: glycoside hydrolase family 3 N-terminal domain-containing protein, partial [Bryocella sp.]